MVLRRRRGETKFTGTWATSALKSSWCLQAGARSGTMNTSSISMDDEGNLRRPARPQAPIFFARAEGDKLSLFQDEDSEVMHFG